MHPARRLASPCSSSRLLVLRLLAPGLAVALAVAALPARAEVDLADPVQGPSVDGAIPPLPQAGSLVNPPPAVHGPNWVHEGRYTLIADPSGVPPSAATCPALPDNPSGTQAADALPGYFDQAALSSNDTLSKLDGGTILDAFKTFKDVVTLIGGTANVSIGDPTPVCEGWSPVQARWLKQQYVPRNFYFLPGQSEFHYDYSGRPNEFREIRERGARLYCAARNAQFHQQGVASMGERVGFSAMILGKKIDFLVVEPTLVLDGPERFTGMGANDGAQAFEVPLLLGTRITPIRGLGLPSFGETRVPVAMLTADTELRTDADLRPVRTGSSIQCSFEGGPPFGCKLVPHYETKHAKTYQTVTHLDRLRSAHQDASVDGKAEVFRIGPLAVSLGFKVSYFLGHLGVANDRVIDLPGAGLPPGRTGRLWIHPFTGSRRHDGAWGVRFFGNAINDSIPGIPFWTVLPDGLTDPFWRENLNFLFPPPLDIRLFHDDDHAIDSKTGLGIEASLSGLLGGSFGPFDVSLTVTGSLVGDVAQHHLLREALMAEDLGGNRMTPATALRVRPQQTAEAHLNPAKGTLHLHLPLPFPFDDIDITKTLFSVPSVSLAQYDSDDSLGPAYELTAFHLGTGSAKGNVTEQPTAKTHLPSGLEFASFPQDVESCLDDPAENPPTPEPCDPVPDPSEPPGTEICLYGPGLGLRGILGSLPPGVCADVASYVAGLGQGPDQSACLEQFLGLLCSPTSKQQTYQGLSVVSHVLDLTDDAEGLAVAQAVAACAAVYSTPTADGDIPTSDAADKFVSMRVCKPDGTLLADDDVWGAVGNPTTAPPVMPASSCH